MGTKVKAPPPRDYGRETRETLEAQLELAPQLLASEQQYRPDFAQLDVDIARGITPQLLDVYEEAEPRLSAVEQAAISRQRAADIADIEALGPRAREALEAAAPEQAALLAELNRQALSDLQAGDALSAFERREIQQATRAGQAARGFGYGPQDLGVEALATLQGAQQRRRERQGFAQSMVGLTQATQADPFMAILGRQGRVGVGAAGGVVGQAGGFSPGPVFSPESAYAANLYGANQQAQLAARTATASNRGALLGGLLGAGGRIGAATILR